MEMLHGELGGNPKVMPIMEKMVKMLETHDDFVELMELYPGIETYGAYMTEKEAKRGHPRLLTSTGLLARNGDQTYCLRLSSQPAAQRRNTISITSGRSTL